MVTIFLDESGYTGQDLLNKDQPAFVLATIRASERKCQQWKAKYFKIVRATELKHAVLAKRPAQQKLVLDFLRSLSQQPQNVKVLVAHKRFALTAKLVDVLVEPVAAADGVNLYQEGAAANYANLLFYSLPAIGGEVFFEDLLRRFQVLIRTFTQEAYDHFFQPLITLQYPEPLGLLLAPFRHYHAKLGYAHLTDFRDQMERLQSVGGLDIGLTSTLSLMIRWKEGSSEPIELIHDASTRMAKERHIWNALVDTSLTAKLDHPAEYKPLLPLGIARTRLEKSQDWAGLQLADVLAGATAQWLRWIIEEMPTEDEYGSTLEKIIPHLIDYKLWPSEDFSEQHGIGNYGPSATLKEIQHIFSTHFGR